MNAAIDLHARWFDLLLEEARARHPGLPDDPAALARKVAPQVVALSKGLTRDRPLPGERYLDTRELALAYLLYYLPVNLYKSRVLLARAIGAARLASRAALKVADLGCGPGTQLWALLWALTAARTDVPAGTARLELHYRGVDHSGPALDLLRSISRRVESEPALTAGIDLRIERVKEPLHHPKALPEAGQDLILLGNVLNEVGGGDADPQARRLALVQALWERLAPGGVLFILEPGLQAMARSVGEIRDALRERPDLTILSPCTHTAPCPLVASDRPANQWCHQEIPWQRPPVIEALDRLTGLNKDRLTLSHLLLWRGQASLEPAAGSYRALSPALKGKGTVTVHLCGAGGFQEAMLLTRNRSEANDALLEVARGDEVVLRGAAAKGAGLRIEGETGVEVRPLALELA